MFVWTGADAGKELTMEDLPVIIYFVLSDPNKLKERPEKLTPREKINHGCTSIPDLLRYSIISSVGNP